MRSQRAVSPVLVLFLVGCAANSAHRTEHVSLAGRRPNIVFVLADDLGWRDVGFSGAEFFETPHIDRLAQDGVIFHRAYTCGPNCAPTRACLISGMYTPRHHIYTPGRLSKGKLEYMKLLVPARRQQRRVDFPPSRAALDPSVVSFAEVLKQAGYRTGHFGKWHVGPDAQGFDVFGSDGTPGKRRTHYRSRVVADKLTAAGEQFIAENKDAPFFLYLSHWDVHTPIRAKAEVVAKYQAKLDRLKRDGTASGTGGQDWNPTYAAMIEAVDKSVGRLRAKLEEVGLTKSTLFVFSSDNGGLPRVTDNRPLRGGKGSLFEGGIRVPTCMTWPGKVRPGTENDVPVTSVDFLPTFCELAGVELPTSQPVDGRSIVPLLEGKDALRDRPIFWFFPLYLVGGRGNQVLPVFGTDRMYWRGVPAAAVVQDNFKLIRYFEDDSIKLFDVRNDVGEANDLSQARPEKAKAMLATLNGWLTETKAPVPR